MPNPNVPATVFTYLGGLFQIGNGGSPETFTAITQVTAVDFSGDKRATQKITTADNTDGFERFIGTLRDAGEVQVDLLWNPADTSHQLLITNNDGNLHNMKRVIGTHITSWAGIVTSLTFKEEIDKPTKATYKIKISGPITIAAA